ncbi:MAG TPA: 50S ribosomal protein L21 [Firmicutes bacterium]|jgi:large subunit ribosomal protein L21|nr:50S ribosomal protein L21 [Bacillota bacterium]
MKMYAVIKTGGKQYLVRENDKIFIEKIDKAVGESVEFTPIMVNDGTKMISDSKGLENAKVVCKVKEHFRGKKVKVYYFRRRKDSDKTIGHRQNMVTLVVESITK